MEAEHENEKAISIGLGNVISPQSLHLNFMFLYRGLYFMQSISKSITIAAEEPIQLYVYYKHMALAWLSPAGDTSWGVWGGGGRGEKDIWNLKMVHCHIYLGFSERAPFFLCHAKLPHL